MSTTILLLKIKKMTDLFYQSLEDLISKKQEINDLILTENNIEYEKLINIIDDMELYFDEYTLKSLKNMIKCFREEISNSINNICQHIIVEDDIDISLDESRRIKYCEKCEQTF